MYYSTTLKTLTKLFGHSNYFIAGGYATYPKESSDIDIYFYTKEDFDKANAGVLSNYLFGGRSFVEPTSSTKFATTYHHILTKPTQLIRKDFGTPEEITSNFDLNKCRGAILSDGTQYFHPTQSLPLYADLSRINVATPNRILKYFTRSRSIDMPKFKELVYTLATNPNAKAEDYYDGDTITRETPYKVLLNTLVSNFQVMTPVIFSTIDSLPQEEALTLYKDLILPRGMTDFVITPTQSTELQLYISLSTGEYSQLASDKYPEYFI